MVIGAFPPKQVSHVHGVIVVRGHAQREQQRGPGHEALGVSALRLGLGPEREWVRRER